MRLPHPRPAGPANWTGWWEDSSTTFCALIDADLALTALSNAPNTTLPLNLRCKANIDGEGSHPALPGTAAVWLSFEQLAGRPPPAVLPCCARWPHAGASHARHRGMLWSLPCRFAMHT